MYEKPKRLGLFSYGSGCSAEFYSGIVTSKSQEILNSYSLSKHLDERYMMSVDEYEETIVMNKDIRFGTRDYQFDSKRFPKTFSYVEGKNRLVFAAIKNFHRIYEWV